MKYLGISYVLSCINIIIVCDIIHVCALSNIKISKSHGTQNVNKGSRVR